MKKLLAFSLLLSTVTYAQNPLPTAGRELGIFRSTADTTPFMSTVIPNDITTCREVTTPTVAIQPVINPTDVIWSDSATTECRAPMPTYLSSVPQSSTYYVGKVRAWGLDPNAPATKVYGPWSTVSNTFWKPMPFLLNCPPPVVAIGPQVAYTQPGQIGGALPVQTSCSPMSESVFPPGTSTVSCVSTDSIQRKASCSFTVTVNPIVTPPPPPPVGDVTSPIISSISSRRSGNSSNWTVTVVASDNVGVDHVDYLVDGIYQARTSVPSTSGWVAQVKITSAGLHIITARAYDLANTPPAVATIQVKR